MFNIIKKDINRYLLLCNSTKMKARILTLWDHPEILAIIYFRFFSWAKKDLKIPVFGFLFSIIETLTSRIFKILIGVSISNMADIGPGLYIGHYGGIFIAPIKMGENCNISQGVTIGWGGRGANWGVPIIGDRVYFGPGTVIFGKITIGNDVAIGANAVVTKDIPDKAVVVGNPSKIISYNGSKDFIIID